MGSTLKWDKVLIKCGLKDKVLIKCGFKDKVLIIGGFNSGMGKRSELVGQLLKRAWNSNFSGLISFEKWIRKRQILMEVLKLEFPQGVSANEPGIQPFQAVWGSGSGTVVFQVKGGNWTRTKKLDMEDMFQICFRNWNTEEDIYFCKEWRKDMFQVEWGSEVRRRWQRVSGNCICLKVLFHILNV